MLKTYMSKLMVLAPHGAFIYIQYTYIYIYIYMSIIALMLPFDFATKLSLLYVYGDSGVIHMLTDYNPAQAFQNDTNEPAQAPNNTHVLFQWLKESPHI
jgi:hypothetical protein